MAGLSLKQTLNLPSTRFPMKADLATSEPRRLKRWQEQDLYGQVRAARHGQPIYVLHDGPPYANGVIHMGTALNKIVKDFIVRSKTLAGFDSPYVPGWDCHGLPIEIKVDQELGAKKAGMPALSIRQACRKYAMKFVDIQRRDFERLGVLGQWNDPYLTLTPHYEATIARLILQFIREERAYRGLRTVYWCIHDRTALAEAEVEYENHESPTVWVRYRFDADGPALPAGLQADPRRLYALTWTTTPWTLPASVALAFHPELEYVVVRAADGNEYLLAAARLEAAARAASWGTPTILGRVAGQALEGLRFKHPWLDRPIAAVLADYVTTEQGSGIVHTAPGHGGEDFATGEKYHLPILCPVDAEGRFFGPDTAPFTGQQVFAANAAIVAHLDQIGALVASARLAHSYPHCWRCHQPIIFRATEQWFISMERRQLRSQALAAVQRVKWDPAWGERRMAGMVGERPDWCISRQRVWGVPIPVFACTHCHQHVRNDALDERIVAIFAAEGSDAWFSRPASAFVPEGTRCAHCGREEFQAERDIVDVWFESGSSQAAVLGHSPQLPWPANLYIEGGDQFRGWFQSSLLVAVGSRGEAPFREVLCHGWVVDANGRAMSKSLGNNMEPQPIVEKFGAEIVRLWVAGGEYREDVAVSDEILSRVVEVYRKIRNTFRYMLSNLGDFDPAHNSLHDSELWELDRYMLHTAAKVGQECEREYAGFEFHRVYRRLVDFCTAELSAFYLDVLKDRMYTFAPDSRGRRSGQTATWKILEMLVRLFAPLLPFTTEEVWENMPASSLNGPRAATVHIETFAPVAAWLPPAAEQAALEARWEPLRKWRERVLAALEESRREKRIGTGLEARVELLAPRAELAPLEAHRDDLPALFIVSQVTLTPVEGIEAGVRVHAAEGAKCPRCWNYALDVDPNTTYPDVRSLCGRCRPVVASLPGPN